VGGDEIDAGVGIAAAYAIQIAGAGEPLRKLAYESAVAFPVGAHRIAVFVVPLGPAEREISHLITALAQVPGLGHQFDLGEHGILMNDVEESAEPVDLVQLARERRGEIEAEAVDVHLETQ